MSESSSRSDLIKSDTDEDSSSENSSESPVKRNPNEIRPSGGYFDLFRCYYCSEYFELPVKQCINNDLICHSCVIVKKNLSMCPICGIPIMEGSERPSYGRIMSEMEIDCQWKANGCQQKLPLSSYRPHIRSCEFSVCKTKCYFALYLTKTECQWIGLSTEIIQHMVDEHSFKVFEIDSISQPLTVIYYLLEKEISRPSQKIIKVNLENSNFIYLILEYFYDSESKEALFMVRSEKPTKSFKFRIELLNKENESVFALADTLTCNFLDKFPIDAITIPSSMCAKIPFSKLAENKFKIHEEEENRFSIQVNLYNI